MSHGNDISEHEIQAQILDWLERKHIYHFRMNVGAFLGEYTNKQGFKKKRFVKFGPPGAPDIFVVVRGQITGIEVKSGNGFQSQVQKEFEVEFTRAGGKYILAFSLDDAIRGLNGRA